MVQATLACCFQALGGLSGDASGLVGWQWPLEQDRGQRLRAGHRLLDNERVVVLGSNVEDAHQSGVLHPCRPAGRV